MAHHHIFTNNEIKHAVIYRATQGILRSNTITQYYTITSNHTAPYRFVVVRCDERPIVGILYVWHGLFRLPDLTSGDIRRHVAMLVLVTAAHTVSISQYLPLVECDRALMENF